MGIITEYNPDLALRHITEFKQGRRRVEECVPEVLQAGSTYAFLKKGQRNYWFGGELPLLETDGNGTLSRPKASIIMIEATHFLLDGEVYTKGQYQVVKVLAGHDIYFEGFSKIATE